MVHPFIALGKAEPAAGIIREFVISSAEMVLPDPRCAESLG
jgi:hypothetical protein